MESIFAPPSLSWFLDKVKELRRVIGTKRITHRGATNLLARMYGWRYEEIKDLTGFQPPLLTEWDDQLDEHHLEERYGRFVDELRAELHIEGQACQVILEKAKVSARESTGPDDIDDFANRLTSLLKDLGPKIAAARGGRASMREGTQGLPR